MKSTSSVIALVAAIAPLALAAPFNVERVAVDVVTDTAVVTQVAQATVWETEGAAPAPSTSAAPAPASSAHQHGAHGHSWSWSQESAAPTSLSSFSAPALPTSSVQVPATTAAPPPPPPTTTAAPPPPPSTSQAPAPTSASSSGSGNLPSGNINASGDDSYQVSDDGSSGNMAAIMVDAHNKVRSVFQAPPVTWNQSLVDMAVTSLNNPEYQCNMVHSNAGQNLAMRYKSAQEAFDGWSMEYSKLNFDSPDFGEDTGHFTQVVWQDSTSIGCKAHNCDGAWNLICNYFPVGNMLGEFPQNIKKATGTVPKMAS